MTVMDTLHRKGFLRREMVGRAWIYQPTASRQDYTARLMHDTMAQAGDQTGVLAHFVARMSEHEVAALRSLLRQRPGTRR
jgi:predicted transcriptional regulator